MKLLSVEAALAPASVALNLGEEVIEWFCDDPKAQAESVLDLIEQLLQKHQLTLGELDGLAVGRGPGSFTGLRVAAALVQGLAFSANKNVANVSSLAATAHQTFLECAQDTTCLITEQGAGTEQPLLVCLDARKSQVYCAMYNEDNDRQLRALSDEAVLDPSEVVARYKGKATWGTGNGFTCYPELQALGLTTVADVNPSARAVAGYAATGSVSFDAPYLATPEYVRNNVTHGS